MRKTSKKTRIIIFFSLLLLFSLATVLYASTTSKPADRNIMGLPYFQMPGNDITIAQTNIPSQLNLPNTLGTPTETKFDNNTKTLIAIYGTTKPASDAQFIDVVNNNLILNQSPSNLTLDSAKKNIADAILATQNDTGALQAVYINGYYGCQGGNLWHTVTWYTNTTYYQLEASVNYPLQNLVNIAKSIT